MRKTIKTGFCLAVTIEKIMSKKYFIISMLKCSVAEKKTRRVDKCKIYANVERPLPDLIEKRVNPFIAPQKEHFY